jgi:hypothetical protein
VHRVAVASSLAVCLWCLPTGDLDHRAPYPPISGPRFPARNVIQRCDGVDGDGEKGTPGCPDTRKAPTRLIHGGAEDWTPPRYSGCELSAESLSHGV